MKKVLLFLLVTLLLVYSTSNYPKVVKADDTPTVSVKLKNYLGNQTQLTITIKGEYDTSNPNLSLVEGKTYTVKVENNALSLYEDRTLITSNTTLTMTPKVYGTSNYILINNRPYLGSMTFNVENNSYVRPINTLPLEDYLKGVVPFEMMASWNIEALKAQAVAARTYAERHASIMMDDTVSYQAYDGYAWNPNSTAAVDQTKSQILTYNGQPIDAFYSASNGGITESNANVWGGTALPFYPIKEDPYDSKDSWGFTLNKTQINTSQLDLAHPENWWATTNEVDQPLSKNIKYWLNLNGYANYDIKLIAIPSLSFSANKTSGGRVQFGTISLQFLLKDKTTGQFVMDSNNNIKINTLTYINTSASRIRAMIGATVIKSYLVTTAADNGTTYTINGIGNGHGVGMSQMGAKKMADLGHSYQDILNFYFPGASLTNIVESSDSNLSTETNSVTPAISNITSSYNAQNQLLFDFTINEAANVTVYLKNSEGKILSYLLQITPQKAGSIHLVYKPSGLQNGTYSVGIIMKDSTNQQASYLKSVIIKTVKVTPKVTVNQISNKDKVITGTTSPNAHLTVTSGKKVLGTGKADSKGKFSVSIHTQPAGTPLSVTAKDVNGNTSSPTMVKVVDKIPPAVPKVYTVKSRDTAITGQAEAKSTVIVKSGSKLIGTGKVGSTGKFRITIHVQKAGTTLTVSAKDPANNVSPSISFKVQK